jgi:hypothetical protein
MFFEWAGAVLFKVINARGQSRNLYFERFYFIRRAGHAGTVT